MFFLAAVTKIFIFGAMKYVRADKQIRPLTIGLPADLNEWLRCEAQQDGIPVSRLATQILEAARKYRTRQRRRETSIGGDDRE